MALLDSELQKHWQIAKDLQLGLYSIVLRAFQKVR
jgi:hypothetical protein